MTLEMCFLADLDNVDAMPARRRPPVDPTIIPSSGSSKAF